MRVRFSSTALEQLRKVKEYISKDNPEIAAKHISYSSKDRDWVSGWLLPRLEAAGVEVCIGFRFCDLLLDQGQWEEVIQRAEQSLEITSRVKDLLSIGLDHLTLGRVGMLQAEARGEIDFSVPPVTG